MQSGNYKEIPKRLAPKPETIKQLLARSGNECAFIGCTNPIISDEGQLVGECCHIEAALPDGERYNENQTNEDRRAYDNLLFLCAEHHKVTNDVLEYPVARLKQIKADHEARFKVKPFHIRPNYVDQVLETFYKFVTTTKETN
jgi:hypothetical protein